MLSLAILLSGCKSREVLSYTDGQLELVINYGIRFYEMPGFKNIVTCDEIWSIVVYLRHLPPSRPVGEPEMYSH